MATKGSGKYLVNDELTNEALMTTELIKKCTFEVGSVIPVRIDNSGGNKNDETDPKSRQYHQKFVEVSYPTGEKSKSMVLPNVVMHHKIEDYYKKPSIYVGVPQSTVKELSLKLAVSGEHPIFSDKRIMSDSFYWWVRASFTEAEDEKEYIRIIGNDGVPDYYASFADLFADYPTSMLANVTCSLKLKTDTPFGEMPKHNTEWRAGLSISMFTPFDAIEVNAPTTGNNQRSAIGAKDKMKPGLAKFKKSG